MKSHTRNIFSVTAVTSLLNAVNFGGNFLIAIGVSRVLGVEQLGIFSFILAVVMIAGVVTDFGFSTLLVRKFNESPAEAFSSLGVFNRLKLLLASAVLVLLAVTGALFSPQFFTITFALGIAVLVPRLYQATYDSAARAMLNRILPVAVRSVTTLVQLAASYVLLVKRTELYWIFVMIFVTESFSAIYMKFASAGLITRAGYKIGSSNPISPRDAFKEAVPFFLFNFFSVSAQRIYPIALEYLVSSVAVGIFSAAQRFSSGAGLVTGALSNTYYPAMTSKSTTPAIKYALTKKFSLYAFAAGSAVTAMLFFGSDIFINLTFQIEAAKPVMKLTSFIVIPLFVYTILQAYLISVHMEKFLVRIYGAAWALALVLSIALIPSRGYIGAAIVTITIEYLLLIVQLLAFFKSGKHNNLDGKQSDFSKS